MPSPSFKTFPEEIILSRDTIVQGKPLKTGVYGLKATSTAQEVSFKVLTSVSRPIKLVYKPAVAPKATATFMTPHDSLELNMPEDVPAVLGLSRHYFSLQHICIFLIPLARNLNCNVTDVFLEAQRNVPRWYSAERKLDLATLYLMRSFHVVMMDYSVGVEPKYIHYASPEAYRESCLQPA